MSGISVTDIGDAISPVVRKELGRSFGPAAMGFVAAATECGITEIDPATLPHDLRVIAAHQREQGISR